MAAAGRFAGPPGAVAPTKGPKGVGPTLPKGGANAAGPPEVGLDTGVRRMDMLRPWKCTARSSSSEGESWSPIHVPTKPLVSRP